MESSVKFVNIIDAVSGESKTVDIVDGDGNLKYEFLIHLFETGVLISDEYSTAAFRSIVNNYRVMKDKYDKLCSETKMQPHRTTSLQELGSMFGQNNNYSGASESNADETSAWLDEIMESFDSGRE